MSSSSVVWMRCQTALFFRLAGDDGVLGSIAFQRRIGSIFGVEAEVLLAFRGVESVACEALVREDGADMGVEGNLLRQRISAFHGSG